MSMQAHPGIPALTSNNAALLFENVTTVTLHLIFLCVEGVIEQGTAFEELLQPHVCRNGPHKSRRLWAFCDSFSLTVFGWSAFFLPRPSYLNSLQVVGDYAESDA